MPLNLGKVCNAKAQNFRRCKIFRVAVNGSHFPSGRKVIIISTAIGDIAASDAMFAGSKGSFGDITKMSLRLSVRWKATRGVV